MVSEGIWCRGLLQLTYFNDRLSDSPEHPLSTSGPATWTPTLKGAQTRFLAHSDGIETAFRLCSALGEVINTTSTRFSDMCGSALMHWFQKHRVFLVLDEGLGRLASRIIYIFLFAC